VTRRRRRRCAATITTWGGDYDGGDGALSTVRSDCGAVRTRRIRRRRSASHFLCVNRSRRQRTCECSVSFERVASTVDYAWQITFWTGHWWPSFQLALSLREKETTLHKEKKLLKRGYLVNSTLKRNCVPTNELRFIQERILQSNSDMFN